MPLFTNRVYDSVASDIVFWDTSPVADSAGASYPGPGTFGVHTSDYTVAGIKGDGVVTGPVATTVVDQDDSPVTIAFNERYIVDNDGGTQANDITLNLPAISDDDLDKRIWVNTRYTHEPESGVSGQGVLTGAGTDEVHIGALLGGSAGTLDLVQSEDNMVLRPYKEGAAYFWMFE